MIGLPVLSAGASNYGEAGALGILGPEQGLRMPAASAHDGYLFWGPPPGTPDAALCVGEWNETYPHRFGDRAQLWPALRHLD